MTVSWLCHGLGSCCTIVATYICHTDIKCHTLYSCVVFSLSSLVGTEFTCLTWTVRHYNHSMSCHCCSLQFPSFHLCLFVLLCIYPVMTVLAYLLDDALMCVACDVTWRRCMYVVHVAIYVMFQSHVQYYTYTYYRQTAVNPCIDHFPHAASDALLSFIFPSLPLLCNCTSEEKR